MDTVAIVGVGLMGGSFALGLRAAGFRGRILGVSSPRALEAALARGVIDEGLPLKQAVPAADLIYLANPIDRILEILPEVARLARPGSLTTDAGSTKVAIVDRAAECFRGSALFLGGHPMAGKAERGVEAAEAGLLRGAPYVLTPASGVLPKRPAVRSFLSWLDRLGVSPIVLSPHDHDRIVAFTSHLPQLASSALASVVLENTRDPAERAVSGGGLRDTTRLARSAFDLWRDIVLTNTENIDCALSAYIEKLQRLRTNLRATVLKDEFERGAALLDELSRPS